MKDHSLTDYLFHIDKILPEILNQYGYATYFIIFIIVFCETGLIVTPFLPGDSLIFAIGAISQMGEGLNVYLITIILIIAAITGDMVNYTIGRIFGEKILNSKAKRIIKQEYIEKTQLFYEKHGGKTIILARFMPIVRTFAPFVAGIAKMNFIKFIMFNVAGGITWVLIFISAGYFFGRLEFVQKNFELVALAIIFISILPGIIAYIRSKLEKKREKAWYLLPAIWK